MAADNKNIKQLTCLKLMDSENGKMLSKCGYLGFHFAQNMSTDTSYRDCVDISFNSSDK
jgi:hypothetical protein